MYFRGIQPSTTFSLSLLDRFGLSQSGTCKPRSDEARMLLPHPSSFIFAVMAALFGSMTACGFNLSTVGFL
jgi:hypothetical protein